jgi:serine protease Do
MYLKLALLRILLGRLFKGYYNKLINKRIMEIEKNNKEEPTKAVDTTPEKPSKKGIFLTIVILVIVVSSGFGAIFGFMAGSIAQKVFPNVLNSANNLEAFLGNNTSDSQDVVKQKVVEEDSAVIDVVKKATPAVVSIIISKDMPKVQDFFSDPFSFPGLNPFENPGTPGQGGTEKEQIGGGSGFIISQDGMIVTNKHVVSDTAADYTVVTSDDKEHPAKVLAKDPVNDIAIIKIDGSGYSTIDFGDSKNLQIGQTVVAIGNSLGQFTNTVSRGIISGLKRNLTAGGGLGSTTEQLSDIIQTDAAINPGNSGGPLLDINGTVIGINVAMAQGAQNIGFAIPSDQIQKIADQVKTTGKISTPYIGIRYIPVDNTIQQENNLPYNYGSLVMRGQKLTDFAVIPGSPADKAGILENDIILEVNGTKIDQNNSLAALISRYKVGDTLTLKIWRKGAEKEVQVTLAELNQNNSN